MFAIVYVECLLSSFLSSPVETYALTEEIICFDKTGDLYIFRFCGPVGTSHKETLLSQNDGRAKEKALRKCVREETLFKSIQYLTL